jgi:Ca2+-binding RTX toxin-like protein
VSFAGIGGENDGDTIRAGAGNDFATGQTGADVVSGDEGDDQLFGGPADDVLQGGDGADTLVGNFGSDTLLGGKGDDLFLGGNPNGAPDTGTSDTCNGQQGTDLAVIDSCEALGQMEGEIPFPEG